MENALNVSMNLIGSIGNVHALQTGTVQTNIAKDLTSKIKNSATYVFQVTSSRTESVMTNLYQTIAPNGIRIKLYALDANKIISLTLPQDNVFFKFKTVRNMALLETVSIAMISTNLSV